MVRLLGGSMLIIAVTKVIYGKSKRKLKILFPVVRIIRRCFLKSIGLNIGYFFFFICRKKIYKYDIKENSMKRNNNN